jgi:hypothetical protein
MQDYVTHIHRLAKYGDGLPATIASGLPCACPFSGIFAACPRFTKVRHPCVVVSKDYFLYSTKCSHGSGCNPAHIQSLPSITACPPFNPQEILEIQFGPDYMRPDRQLSDKDTWLADENGRKNHDSIIQWKSSRFG